MTKFCGGCQTEKPFSDFYNTVTQKSGLMTQCKECVKARVKKWAKNNPDKVRKRSREYAQKHRVKIKEYQKNYYEHNKEELKKSNTQWNKDHPEVHAKSSAQYRLKIRENESSVISLLVSTARKRAEQKKLEFEITKEILYVLIKTQNNKCAITNFQFDYTVDKIYKRRPFSPSIDRIDSKLGYTLSNIQIVCNMVNAAKNEYSQELFDEMCKARVWMINEKTKN